MERASFFMAGLGVALLLYAGFLAVRDRRRRPRDVDWGELFGQVEEAHHRGQDEAARALLQPLLQLDPLNPLALHLEVRIALRTSHVDEVARRVETVLNRVPNPGAFALLLARAYLDLNDARRAQHWWHLAEQDPQLEDHLALDRDPAELQMRLGRGAVSYA